MNDEHIGGLILAIIFIVALIAISTIVIVPAGHRGVLMTFGKVADVNLDEGLHIITPVVNSVAIMSIQTLKYSATASSASKDLQVVSTEVTLNYRIDATKVNKIYQTLSITYEDIVIAPAIQETVKASTAQYTAEQLITERPLVKETIERSLKERLSQFDIIVQTVSITNFDFSPEFNKAIEAKVTAEQNALKAKNDLERIKVEAEQAVAKAKGDSQAIEIINEQLLKSPQYIAYLGVSRWNGVLPLVVSPSSVPFLMSNAIGINNDSKSME